MPKRRRKSRRPSPAAGRGFPGVHHAPAPPPMALSEKIAVTLLAGVLVATALLIDPAAHASFDAPKRLAALVGAGLAAVAALGFAVGIRKPAAWWQELPKAARIALLAAAAGLAWAALAAVLSPRRADSLDSLRAMVLYAAILPLGASAAVARGRTPLLAAFLSATALNAGLSLAQSRGVQPFRLVTFGSRNETGALAGNVGYLATTLALAAVAALGIALTARRRSRRALAVAALALFVVALLVNRNLTSILAVAAGAFALLVTLRGRRALLPIALTAGALALGVLAYPPARGRVFEAVRVARSGDWDRLTTYRFGAWAAALEMARERPLAGWGPGTYAAEFVPHRLEAEIRTGRRYVNPLVTSTYSESHSEYLQAFAETGVPGGIAAIVATGALLAGLGRRAIRLGAARVEAAILFGLLVAGAATALAWFPLQRPISAIPLLLAAGRGWRVVASSETEKSA